MAHEDARREVKPAEDPVSRRFPTLVIIALLLTPASIAAAGEFTLAPFVGFSIGGTVENLQTGATSDLLSGPGFGLIVGYSLGLGPERWIEVLWNHQEVDFCEGCLPGDPNSFSLAVDTFHLGGVYRPGTKNIRPYLTASAGLTVYNLGTADQSTSAGFSFALGGGAEFFLNDSISVRLDGRGLLTFASGTLYVGCSGGCAIGFSGSGNLQLQAFAALVFRIP